MSPNTVLLIPLVGSIFMHLAAFYVIRRLWPRRKANAFLLFMLLMEIATISYLFISGILTPDMFDLNA